MPGNSNGHVRAAQRQRTGRADDVGGGDSFKEGGPCGPKQASTICAKEEVVPQGNEL